MLVPFVLMSLGAVLAQADRNASLVQRRAVLASLYFLGMDRLIEAGGPLGAALLGYPGTAHWLPHPEDRVFLERLKKIRQLAQSGDPEAQRAAVRMLPAVVDPAIVPALLKALEIRRGIPGVLLMGRAYGTRALSGPGSCSIWNASTTALHDVTNEEILDYVLQDNPRLKRDSHETGRFASWLDQSQPGDVYEGLYSVTWVVRTGEYSS